MAAQVKNPPGPGRNGAGHGRNAAGIGMTSQRTRGRMAERLREQGIRDERVIIVLPDGKTHEKQTDSNGAVKP